MDMQTKHQIATFDTNGPVSAPPPRFPGVWISLAWIVVYFVMQLLCGFVVLGIVVALDPKMLASLTGGGLDEAGLLTKFGLPLIVSVLLSGLITLAMLWLHLRKGVRHQQIGLFARSRLSTMHTVVLGVGLMLATMLISYLYSTYVVPGKELQGPVNALIGGIPKTPLNHVILFLTIAVVAPILEELLFRGYLQSALMHHMKPWAAIAIASTVFGIIHFQPLAFPMLAMLGAVFGYLYHKTGSLKVNMALHVINNGAAYVLMALGLSTGA